MKYTPLLACLLLAACNKPTGDQTTDTSSEAAIGTKAAEITAAADAEVNKAISEIETTAPKDDVANAAPKAR